MIGYLKGEVFEIYGTEVLLDVNGVGYRIYPTLSSLSNLKKGEKTFFYITTIIKEDAFDLYGFKSIEEKNLFNLIIGISGIGPRTAIAILSKYKIDDVINAIKNGDADFFSGIPRFGRKNAQKLIIELKSKLGDVSPITFNENSERRDVIDALKGLGYQEKEIHEALQNGDLDEMTVEDKIKYILKHFGKK